MPFDDFLQMNSGPSLGDILKEALRQKEETQPPAPFNHRINVSPICSFKNKRVVDVDHAWKIEQIKRYRRNHGCSLHEAKKHVETMMLVELIEQAESMEDVALIREFALNRFYYLFK